MKNILLPCWTSSSGSEPPDPTGDLFMRVRVSSLSNFSQAGTEVWADENLTDGQANDGLLNWDYTPDMPYSKPVLAGGYITGQAGGFGLLMDSPLWASPQVGVKDFEAFFDVKVTASVTGNFYFIFGTVALDNSSISFRIRTGTGPSLKFFIEWADNSAPFSPTVVGPVTFTPAVDVELGIVVTAAGANSNIDITVNGVVAASAVHPYPLEQIMFASPSFGGGDSGSFSTVYAIHGFTLNTY